jgi:hypothetical protein
MKILLADFHANYSDILKPKTGDMNMPKYVTMVKVNSIKVIHFAMYISLIAKNTTA